MLYVQVPISRYSPHANIQKITKNILDVLENLNLAENAIYNSGKHGSK